ncbi:MAG: DUF362 domain-containing protein [Longimicrobiales bacterium]
MPSTVAITQDLRSIENAIREALAELELESRVRGRLVAVKPNETWASAEDTTGVTQADTLRAVLRAVKQHDPKHVVVSGGAGAAETEDVFRHAGLMAVIEAEDVEFFDHNRPPFEDVELDYGPDREVTGPQKSVKVNPRVLEYETLVAVNQLKVHATATITMALKNIAMSYPAADYYGHPRGSYRRQHHFFDDMHSFIAAMCRRFSIDLAVTVGHPAMIAHGPLGGLPVETGLCIASTDAIAADTVGAALLGFEPQAVRHLWEADKLGLGETDIERMRFPAMSLKEAIGAFTEAAYGRRMTFEHA